MGRINSRLASGLAMAAALSMAATPAFADGRGWGGGWGHRRHHGGDDAGWIIGGIIGLAAIAAIASSASKSKDRRDGSYPERERPEPSGRYGDRQDGQGYASSTSDRSIDGAVDRCVSEIERGSGRVETVETVNRADDGWRVSGRVSGGQNFACTVDGDGRIRNATIDGRAM